MAPGTEFLTVESPDHNWSTEITLAFEWRVRPPIDVSLEALRALSKKSTGWAKLRVLDELRRASWRTPEGLADAEEELALAVELGAVHHQALALSQSAHILTELTEDHARARQVLDALRALEPMSPFAAARWQYYNAVLARRAGDLGTALVGFENARGLSERLNSGVDDVVEMLANTLAELGREEEAQQLFQGLEVQLWESEARCSEWVRRANNLAWGQLVLGASGHEHADPRPLLLAAVDLVTQCPDPWREAALLLDLALAELEYERPLEAQGWLARMGPLPKNLRGWVEMASAAAALDRRDPLSQPALMSQPSPTSEIELAWNQSVREGDLLVAWGFHDLAAEAYRSAEEQLSVTFQQVGTNASGELYVAGRSSSLEGLVEALLQTDRPAEASCAIRLARTREFAQLDRTARLGAATEDERTTWQRDIVEIADNRRAVTRAQATLWELSEDDQIGAAAKLALQARKNQEALDAAIRALGLQPNARSCAELRRPAPGEVILVAFGPHVFAHSRSGIEVAPREDLSSLEALAGASRITLLEAGFDGTQPLHLASWRHANSLLDLAPIAYSLDLPPRAALKTKGRVALVLADPRDDLPEARAEAETVERALEAKSWKVIGLRGADATQSRLLEYAAEVELLHYAGHGIRSGLSGWDSALLLAEDARFGVHDIFALPGVPHGVVLTGCETAAATPDTVGGGMNIGRAFVLAGSEWVIAADTDVDDRFAAEVGIAVQLSDGPDGATRLREALLRLRADDPGLPWGQFRVIVP